MDLGSYGIWLPYNLATSEIACEVEELGFGTLWLGGSPPGDLEVAERMLRATETIVVATAIVNVWRSPANTVAESYHRVEAVAPGRFLLGIGIGHSERTDEYRSPFDTLVSYLDELDSLGVPPARRMLAALGPRVTRLAAQRSAGAAPYLTTPDHTADARRILGSGPLLAPENKVVLSKDVGRARELGRRAVRDPYLGFSNYRRNLSRLGFSEHDLDTASDALIDKLVVYGDSEDVATGLRAHLTAGANHVAIRLVMPFGQIDRGYSAALRSLSSALGVGDRDRHPC